MKNSQLMTSYYEFWTDDTIINFSYDLDINNYDGFDLT